MADDLQAIKKSIEMMPNPRALRPRWLNLFFVSLIFIPFILTVIFLYGDLCDEFASFPDIDILDASSTLAVSFWLIVSVVACLRVRWENQLMLKGMPVIAKVTDFWNHKLEFTINLVYTWNGIPIIKSVRGREKPEGNVLIVVDPDKPEKIIIYDKGSFFRFDFIKTH
jgi:hypothetical protein